MTPKFCTGTAERLFPYRWWLLAASFIGIAAVWTLAFLSMQTSWIALPVVLSFFMPLLSLLWAALCCAFWFHPTRGSLRNDAAFFGKLPAFAQSGVRWYAAIFLAFFALAGTVVPPLISLSR